MTEDNLIDILIDERMCNALNDKLRAFPDYLETQKRAKKN